MTTIQYKSAFTVTVLLLSVQIIFSQTIPTDSLYFGQTPPGNIPMLFAPGIVSLPGRNEAVITFSPDGSTVFFYIEKWPQPGNPYTLIATYTDHWSVPDTVPFTIGRSTGEPFFGSDGQRVYMFATNAIDHVGTADLSYSERQESEWSEPISMGNPPNEEAYQFHPCIVGDTSVYFSSNAGKICRSQYANGLYQTRHILPVPINHIGSQTWGDPYVATDESYMIFKSIRPGGFGQNDLYIAYRKADNSWTNPKNLGSLINSSGNETSGDITPDGLFMTYGSNNDLYWVSTAFIDSLRYTNFIPYVKNPIPDQIAITDEWFACTIPDTTFVDDDGNNTLTFGATLTDGSPLPGWLCFDTLTAGFSGSPSVPETLHIRITATDTAWASTSTNWTITVTTENGLLSEEIIDASVFPNPTTGVLTVSLHVPADTPALIEVYTPDGNSVLKDMVWHDTSINLSDKPKGIYLLKLLCNDRISVCKICLV